MSERRRGNAKGEGSGSNVMLLVGLIAALGAGALVLLAGGVALVGLVLLARRPEPAREIAIAPPIERPDAGHVLRPPQLDPEDEPVERKIPAKDLVELKPQDPPKKTPDPRPDRKPRPVVESFAEEVLTAWGKAGIPYVLIYQDESLLWSRNSGQGESRPDEVPGFRLGPKAMSKLASLPPPNVDFGIDTLGIKTSDETLKELARFDRLVALNLRGQSTITDAGLMQLASLKKLRYLSCQNTKGTDASLKAIGTLTELKYLWTPGGITDAGLADLAGLKNLDSLVLGGRVNGSGLKCLAGIKLKKLWVTTGLSNADLGLAALANFPELETLEIAGGFPGNPVMKHVATLPKLRSLDLRNTSVNASGFKELAALPELQTLKLPYSINDAGLAEVGKLAQLRSISIQSGGLTEQGFKHLTGLQQLESLSLSQANVTDAAMKDIAKLKGLRTLRFTQVKISDDGLKELKELKELRSLVIFGTSVTRAGAALLLRELPELKIEPPLEQWRP